MIYHTFIARELVATRIRDLTVQASRHRLAAQARHRKTMISRLRGRELAGGIRRLTPTRAEVNPLRAVREAGGGSPWAGL